MRQIISTLGFHHPRRIFQTSISTIALLAAFVCQKHSEELFVWPNSLAHRYLLFCLREELDVNHDKIHVVTQGRNDGIVPDYYIESFGRPSSEAHWIINDWVNAALREIELQIR